MIIHFFLVFKSLEVYTENEFSNINFNIIPWSDRLCGLVVRVLGYRSGGPSLIPGTTREKKSSGSGTGSCVQLRSYFIEK
jgi:hypothetical protein